MSSGRHIFRIEARSATRRRCGVAGLACLWTATMAGPAFAQSASAGIGSASRDVAAGEAQLIPPTVLEQRQPEYPTEALPKRLAGDVAVTVTIGPTGAVTGTELSRGVAPDLDRAAMETASRWRFRPATRDGVAIASRVQLVFHFEPPPVSLTPPSPLSHAERPLVQRLRRPLRRQPSRRSNPSQSSMIAKPSVTPPPPAALDVTVLGRRPPPSRGASDFQIRVDQLADVPRANALCWSS